MKFLSLFDVIGPNMIGPSSSHTAGAASIGLFVSKMFARPIKKAVFTLYGSFAQTYQGHGTDRALLGGVLGWAALQPLPVIAAVFTATGIGMALPYLILAAWPGAARILPKPGPWTGIMERLVGFFLMGTAIYLLSILPESQRLPALVTLLVCALAAALPCAGQGRVSARGSGSGSWAGLAAWAVFAAGFVFSFCPFGGDTRSLRKMRREQEEDPRR